MRGGGEVGGKAFDGGRQNEKLLLDENKRKLSLVFLQYSEG